MENSTKKTKWDDRISGALTVLNKASEKQKFEAEHTADKHKLRVGLKVFVIDDPTVLWTISEIEEQVYRRKVTLEAKDRVSIKKTTSKLFVDQKRAVVACINDIKNAENIILRDMRESLDRLDAPNRIKEMNDLKNQLSKGKQRDGKNNNKSKS